MIYNRLCNTEDFPAMGLPLEPRRRKAWEIYMAIAVVGDVDGLDVLGVGSGTDPTIAEVCNRGGRMWATDLYAQGGWSAFAPTKMLLDPAGCFSQPFDARRLVVQHMDARHLRFPDGMFDRCISLSSIEHFGSDLDIARAAMEIGRVMKPRGIAAIVTEYKISGDGNGWDNVRLFDQVAIDELIIKPSGMERIDIPRWTLSGATMLTSCPLESILEAFYAGRPVEHDDIVLEHHGYQFTSVMLALRKPE